MFPNELLLPILNCLTAEELDQLSLVNLIWYRRVRAARKDSYFWRCRYQAMWGGTDRAAEKLLPEMIDHYGWKKLYHLYHDRGQEHSVDPVGNVYYWDGTKHHLVTTIPMRECLLFRTYHDILMVLYLDFSHGFHGVLARVTGTELKISIVRKLVLFDQVVEKYWDDKFMFLIKQDGSVLVVYDWAKLIKLVHLWDESKLLPDSGLSKVGYLDTAAFTDPLGREGISVNIFSVSRIQNGQVLARYPRATPQYFAGLQKEMNRLSGQ